MSRWAPYFTDAELACHCGQCSPIFEGWMDPEFMQVVMELRRRLDIPFKVTSAYRCPEYNESVSETGRDGPHTTGRAIDIAIYGENAYRLIQEAISHGLPGIGVNQKGDYTGRFVHLDLARQIPWVWTY